MAAEKKRFRQSLKAEILLGEEEREMKRPCREWEN